LVQWKEHFFLAMAKDKNNRLINALLKQIENHRNGEEVDGGMIKSVIDSMGTFSPFFFLPMESPPTGPSDFDSPSFAVALGLEEEQHYANKDNKTHIEVYREYFQKPFLLATEAYYHQESERFLTTNSISDYLKLAEKRLEEEERRVDLYMNTQSRGSC
jgi:cullin 1